MLCSLMMLDNGDNEEILFLLFLFFPLILERILIWCFYFWLLWWWHVVMSGPFFISLFLFLTFLPKIFSFFNRRRAMMVPKKKIGEKLLYTTTIPQNTRMGSLWNLKGGGWEGFKACEIGESWARGVSVFYEIWEEGFFFSKSFLFFSSWPRAGIVF